ncbi:MAG: 5-(carboxyamino)imidazole ribonucleotide synthase [Gemmatimonadota bacterium]
MSRWRPTTAGTGRAAAASIPPGSTIGILGGGQLGRMAALAARPLGYGVVALDPDPACPALPVVDHCVTAAFDDASAAEELARASDVVTIEIEQVAVSSLQAAARHAPVRPGPRVLEVVQDRARQKRWLEQAGFPVGPYREASSEDELAEAMRALGRAAIVKSCRGGYDGRSQQSIEDPGGAAAAWAALGGRGSVVEERLELQAELSVMVARRPGGAMAVYPPALNHHAGQVLDWSVIPAPLDPRIARDIEAIGRGIAEALEVEGLLAVELFLLRDGRLLVNELAPRPHNTFHHTTEACATSQFEQAIRAVCDLPLGAVEVLRPAAVANLFGELWLSPVTPAFEQALRVPGVRLHLYGKRDARPGRKMGHLSALGSTPEEAVERVRLARSRITESAGRPDAAETRSGARAHRAG